MRIDPKPFYVGIDLAWLPKNPSGVAVLNAEAELIDYRYAETMEAILEVIATYPDAAIGVDAPLILPNATGHRPNEREFLKVFSRYGLGVHAANQTLFAKRFPRYSGFTLYEALKLRGFDFTNGNLFEVYPHATILTLFNDGKVLRYKASTPKTERINAMKKLQTALFDIITAPNSQKTDIAFLKGKALKAEEDFLDSLVCSFTLLHCSTKECLCFGNSDIGKLLTPLP